MLHEYVSTKCASDGCLYVPASAEEPLNLGSAVSNINTQMLSPMVMAQYHGTLTPLATQPLHAL